MVYDKLGIIPLVTDIQEGKHFEMLVCIPPRECDPSRKHAYIILTPLNPSKTGVYRGIHNFFLFLLKNIDGGYSLEPPRRGGSNEYPLSMFWAELWKIW